MVKPMAEQPSLIASDIEPVMACVGASLFLLKELELLIFKIKGICPAYELAHVSIRPNGAANADKPASMAKLK